MLPVPPERKELPPRSGKQALFAGLKAGACMLKQLLITQIRRRHLSRNDGACSQRIWWLLFLARCAMEALSVKPRIYASPAPHSNSKIGKSKPAHITSFGKEPN